MATIPSKDLVLPTREQVWEKINSLTMATSTLSHMTPVKDVETEFKHYVQNRMASQIAGHRIRKNLDWYEGMFGIEFEPRQFNFNPLTGTFTNNWTGYEIDMEDYNDLAEQYKAKVKQEELDPLEKLLMESVEERKKS